VTIDGEPAPATEIAIRPAVAALGRDVVAEARRSLVYALQGDDEFRVT
jgi:hypothetical protein